MIARVVEWIAGRRRYVLPLDLDPETLSSDTRALWEDGVRRLVRQTICVNTQAPGTVTLTWAEWRSLHPLIREIWHEEVVRPQRDAAIERALREDAREALGG